MISCNKAANKNCARGPNDDPSLIRVIKDVHASES